VSSNKNRLKHRQKVQAFALSRWLFSVVCLHSRIPPEVTPETMARLVAVYTEHPEKVDTYAIVCDGCGLLRPKRKYPPLSEWKLLPGKLPNQGPPPWFALPEFFDRCPHCDAEPWTWEGRVEEKHHPWRELAAAELQLSGASWSGSGAAAPAGGAASVSPPSPG
jgi:hypothetical protein